MHFRGRAGPPAHRWWHTGTQVGWTEEGQEDPIMALTAAPTEAPREAMEAVGASGPASEAATGQTDERL